MTSRLGVEIVLSPQQDSRVQDFEDLTRNRTHELSLRKAAMTEAQVGSEEWFKTVLVLGGAMTVYPL